MKAIRVKGSDLRLLIIIVVLAVVVGLISVLLSANEQKGSIWQQPSTFFTASYGTKAMYLAMSQSGYDVTRVRRSLSLERLGELRGLVIAEPQQQLAEHEIDALRLWLRNGGVLVAATDDPDSGLFHLLSSAGEWQHDEKLDHLIDSTSRVTEEFGVAGEMRIAKDDPLLAGVAVLDFGEESEQLDDVLYLPRDRAFSRPEVLYADNQGPAIVRFKCGNGQLIFLANAYPLSNEGIDEADNAVLIANLAAELAGAIPDAVAQADEQSQASEVYASQRVRRTFGGQLPTAYERLQTVGFDEYHLGFAERDTRSTAIAKLVMTGPYGLAMTQVIIVCLIALWATGVKFGRPQDIPPIRRRNRGAFARAAGGMMRAADAGVLTLGTLVDYHRQNWSRAVGLPVHAEDEMLAQAIEKRTSISIRPIIAEVQQRRMEGKVSEQQMLDLAGRMHRISEVLEHGA